MMGRLKHEQEQLFYEFRLDEAVPDDHLVREIAAVLDLSWVHAELAPYYSLIDGTREGAQGSGRPWGYLCATVSRCGTGHQNFASVACLRTRRPSLVCEPPRYCGISSAIRS
jgi:hypothetical protein